MIASNWSSATIVIDDGTSPYMNHLFSITESTVPCLLGNFVVLGTESKHSFIFFQTSYSLNREFRLKGYRNGLMVKRV